jgi:hypothetical protein
MSATRASTSAAASTVNLAHAVAIWRAFHSVARPDSTCSHVNGSRYRNANACPRYFAAPPLDMPTTAPYSAGANSASPGHPGPP